MDNIKYLDIGDEWPPQRRKLLHSVFNDWVTKVCTEAEFDQYIAVREKAMPSQPCSIVKLVSLAFAQPQILDGLPASLVQLMRERNLLHNCDVVAIWPAAGAQHR